MANVLEKIVNDKRAELVEKKQQQPLSSFKARLQVNKISFYDALAADGTSYIFECKKASPSKGLIRENFDLDEICQAYQKEAACFSVLTDEKYFQGKYEYLEYVRSKVPQAIINKDFFVDEYQVYLARYHGANAILLMLSVLDDAEYKTLATLAHQYKMDVLTEVSNLEETERALNLQAKIIGINNRNLRDLSTDLSTTEKLVPMIKQDSRFKGVIISESGIYTNQDIQRLSPLVDGFLVGSALMAQTDLEQAVSQLVYGAVKVCGITSLEQAELVKGFPVSYMGLIFTPESKRYICLESASDIVKASPFKYVGVFVSQSIELVSQYAHQLSLSAVQLHGNEDSEYRQQLRQLLPKTCEIWQTFSIDMNATIDIKRQIKNLQDEIAENLLSRILLDCKVGEQIGGTGQSFNWEILEGIEDKSSLVLAGGISPENIAEAACTNMGILDLNSGLETSPGQKSPDLLTTLFSRLRA